MGNEAYEETRRLIAQSRVIVGRLTELHGEMDEARSRQRKVLDESLEALAKSYANLANLPPVDPLPSFPRSDTSGHSK
jgi:hypothetical protein